MPGVFSSKRNFLFDLDGTLVDSTSAHARAYVEALLPRESALARSFEYARFAGQPTREVFEALGFAGPALGELTASKQRLYREALERGEVRLFEGARELLARLCEMDRRLFLVTGASRVSVERILDSRKIAKFFSGIVTAEDVRTGKPSPEPYGAALSTYGLAAEDCLAVEDGESGIESARGAGVDAVLIHTDLEIDGIIHVRDCANLLKLILG